MCDFTLLQQPHVCIPLQVYVIGKVFGVRTKPWVRFFESLNLLIKAYFFRFYEMCVFKARINSYLNGPCSVREVAGLKKQAEIYPGKCRSEGRTSHRPNFTRFFYSSLGVFTFFSCDCGICNLSSNVCWLNSGKATGMSSFFLYLLFCIQLQSSSSPSYPRSHRKMLRTTDRCRSRISPFCQDEEM